MAQVLGIDLGGTKILAGVVDTETGKVIASGKKRTHGERGAEGVLTQLAEAIDETLQDVKGDVAAAGVGVAGIIDPDSNTLVTSPNLPAGMQGSAIADAVHKQVGVPVRLVNDVQAAAAGEAAFGAGAGHSNFVTIFVGTGIGGAIYRDGEPYRGATNTAGEIGHMTIAAGGRICGCGGLGHLEAYASRTAIVRSIVAALRQGRPSSLRQLVPNPDPENIADVPIRSKALKRALDEGDALTAEKLAEGAFYLAAGLSSLINLYNPPRIILGGGLIDAVDRFFDQTVLLARQSALAVPGKEVEIVKAQLGDYPGVVGAAELAMRARRDEPALTRSANPA